MQSRQRKKQLQMLLKRRMTKRVMGPEECVGEGVEGTEMDADLQTPIDDEEVDGVAVVDCEEGSAVENVSNETTAPCWTRVVVASSSMCCMSDFMLVTSRSDPPVTSLIVAAKNSCCCNRI